MAQAKTVESDMLHIQNQLKAALHSHQALQVKLKVDCENSDVKKELNELQRYIVTLGASQRRLMKILRMKNAIRSKGEFDNKEQSQEKKIQNQEQNDVDKLEVDKTSSPEPLQEKPIVTKKRLEPDINLLENLKSASDLEIESIASSIDRKFGIPLDVRKLEHNEMFLACIELVTLTRATEILEKVKLFKLEYTLKNPLMEIPKVDASQRRRNETYLNCTPKKKTRREPSSEKEEVVIAFDNNDEEERSSQDLPDGPDQPFTEHQFSQESIDSKKGSIAEDSLSS